MDCGLLAASMNYRSPLFWGVLIFWVASVVVHEFAHGLVGYIGGDYTVRERGQLTLNPLRFVDPVMTIGLPALFVLLGGVPLPGGSTTIRNDLLRGRRWVSAVAAAGPLSNLLVFFLCVIPLLPALGWLDPTAPFFEHSSVQMLLGAVALLQLLAILLNLVPIPPLDGFGIIEPYLDAKTRHTLSQRGVRMGLFIAFFVVLTQASFVGQAIFSLFEMIFSRLGQEPLYRFLGSSFNFALYGSP